MAASKKDTTADSVEVTPADVGTLSTLESERRAKAMEIAAIAMKEMSATEFDPEQLLVDIMSAESFDQILDNEVIHLQDIIGQPITVHSATLQESKYEQGMPAYVVMRSTFDSGEAATVITGATEVVTAMVAAHAKGWFPIRFSTTKVTTGNGFDVVKLVRAKPVEESF